MGITQGLNKPKEIFSTEKFKAYSPDMRFRYIQKLIKEFTAVNDGVTKSQIEEELKLTYETVSRHLERLEATGEIYRTTYGKTHVYFSNHKNIHSIGTHEVEVKGRKFFFSVLDQRGEQYIFIQEKVVEPTGNYALRGSVMIPLHSSNVFFSEIKSFLNEFKERTKIGG